jgi:uncharacterized protein (TIGR03437 family)
MKIRNFLLSVSVVAFGLLATTPAHTAPVIQQGAAVNGASFAVAGAPSSAIARGSIFVVFGAGIGPQGLVQANEFPLPLELGGTSIQIRSGGQTFDAVMLYTTAGQVAAVMPSAVPAGSAEVTLRYNGETSNPISIEVAERQVGLFTRSQDGKGIAIVQNYVSDIELPVNAINQSIKPGGVGILWATGLGASANGDDRHAGIVENVVDLSQVKLYVGGKEAEIAYAGRSNCCAGVDQINFVVPQDVPEGCFVPVYLTVGGTISNFASISVSETGSMCPKPYGLSEEEAELLLSKDNIRVGVVNLTQTRTSVSLPIPAPPITNYTDIGVGSFFEYSTAALLDSTGVFGNATLIDGACTLLTYRTDGQSAEVPSSVPTAYLSKVLDAGASISIQGPGGPKQLAKVGLPAGTYQATLNNPLDAGSGYLRPGQYTIGNGGGGADIGAFNFTENIPNFVTWTNRDAISSVNRAQGVKITWTPPQGNSLEGMVLVTGQSYSVSQNVGSVVFCSADPSVGELTIPPSVLQGMVKSEGIVGPGTVPAGSLVFTYSSSVRRFDAPNLDVGVFAVSTADVKALNFD